MTKDEALRLALEALESFLECGYDRGLCYLTLESINEALAEKIRTPEVE